MSDIRSKHFTERLSVIFYKTIRKIFLNLYDDSLKTAKKNSDNAKDEVNCLEIFRKKLKELKGINSFQLGEFISIAETKAGDAKILGNLISQVFTLNLKCLYPDHKGTFKIPTDRNIFHRILLDSAEELYFMPYILNRLKNGNDSRLQNDNKLRDIILTSIKNQIVQIILETVMNEPPMEAEKESVYSDESVGNSPFSQSLKALSSHKSSPEPSVKSEPKPSPEPSVKSESKPSPEPSVKSEPKPSPEPSVKSEPKPSPQDLTKRLEDFLLGSSPEDNNEDKVNEEEKNVISVKF